MRTVSRRPNKRPVIILLSFAFIPPRVIIFAKFLTDIRTDEDGYKAPPPASSSHKLARYLRLRALLSQSLGVNELFTSSFLFHCLLSKGQTISLIIIRLSVISIAFLTPPPLSPPKYPRNHNEKWEHSFYFSLLICAIEKRSLSETTAEKRRGCTEVKRRKKFLIFNSVRIVLANQYSYKPTSSLEKLSGNEEGNFCGIFFKQWNSLK